MSNMRQNMITSVKAFDTFLKPEFLNDPLYCSIRWPWDNMLKWKIVWIEGRKNIERSRDCVDVTTGRHHMTEPKPISSHYGHGFDLSVITNQWLKLQYVKSYFILLAARATACLGFFINLSALFCQSGHSPWEEERDTKKGRKQHRSIEHKDLHSCCLL